MKLKQALSEWKHNLIRANHLSVRKRKNYYTGGENEKERERKRLYEYERENMFVCVCV